jgi:hypothetical protein
VNGDAGAGDWENLKNNAGDLSHEVSAALWVTYGSTIGEDSTLVLPQLNELNLVMKLSR